MAGKVQAVIFDFGNVLCFPPGDGKVERAAHFCGMTAFEFLEKFWSQRLDYDAGLLEPLEYWTSVTGEAFAAPVGWQAKVTVVLLIVISLNIFVGLFNLVPLLPLDGGHLAVNIYETIRSWINRLLGRPDPGQVDMRKLLPVSVGVFALLVGFGLLLILADVINPVHIPQ